MTEKLQKIIAASGLMSRRKAEELIKAGRVAVNGTTAVPGDRADSETDRIEIDGQLLGAQSAAVYLLLNKPRGVVTSMHDEKGRPDLRRYLDAVPTRVFPVGRLDMDSDGLLLLTNDGDFANKVSHPSHMITKAYLVRVKGFDDSTISALSGDIMLDGDAVCADYVHLVKDDGSSAQLLVGIHQGKNRQVRRMCAACGLDVLRLTRIAEGALKLGDLRQGSIRYIDANTARLVFSPLPAGELIINGGK